VLSEVHGCASRSCRTPRPRAARSSAASAFSCPRN
jgi:hypothetical protein